jgi:hypothetical protein
MKKIQRGSMRFIDAHAEGKDLMYPLKDFEKLEHKNSIKHENRGPPPRFSQNPK